MRALLALLFLWLPLAAPAAVTAPVAGHAVTARLMTAEDGVGEGVARLSAGLALEMQPGWKTYWRSPGEVGLPPALDWSGSANVADVQIAYPAPTRFTAFDIENYGYAGAVTYPLTVVLERPGAPARLDLAADLLVCAEICVPDRVELSLDLPLGGGVDGGTAAHLAEWVARVPDDGTASGWALERVHLDADALTLTATAPAGVAAPAVFPEHGGGAFGPPDVRLSPDGRRVWARLDVLAPGEGPLDLTLVDGDRAATLRAEPAPLPPAPPAAGQGLWLALALAALGGLILNLMPCVLPVLSIKLASALALRDAAPARVRSGFLLTSAGILGFFLLLALAAVAARAAGVAVGWGIQFQSPAFLGLVIGLVTLFAANLFGWFEMGLGQGPTTAMSRAAGGGGAPGDVATGAFAALMATPCSAPFLGGAVTYALTAGPAATIAVFGAMGLGLAAPYFLVAAAPGTIRLLPRPGAWMVTLRRVLGGLMLLAGAWFLVVLAGSTTPATAALTGGAAVVLLAALALRRRALPVAVAGLAALVATAALGPSAPRAAPSDDWAVFSEDALAEAVARGETVLVDVTADWCLTCQANKRLVLDPLLPLEGVGTMRADWTRPDPAISSYLAAQGRHGIPFNAVHGPGAPEGVLLPEILTEAAIRAAVDAAR
ncbi:thioredoxin family protein [Jannaschia sp. Os4]|uniref:protein-disulfide reductase DsbD family protein n=1 Tax=Jannaschia sp. Os4 TaxID=2807617 RepID=UPI00193A6DA7|nr:protein-disulfide reductase DsbD domain-containing protein [Jannaschia sp. Os4]MBM2577738.1 thioredoxin family protein [Jannaschia sp. Os4]